MNSYRSWEAGGREWVVWGTGRPSGGGRKRGEGGAKEERRKGEGRAKAGRTDGEGLRMVWGWCGDGNGVGLWLNGKKCVFLQNNTDS